MRKQRVGEPAALDVKVGETVELEPVRLRGQDVAEHLVLLEGALGLVVEDRDVVHVVALGHLEQVHRDGLDAARAQHGRLGGEHAVVHARGLHLVEDGVAERLAHHRLDRAGAHHRAGAPRVAWRRSRPRARARAASCCGRGVDACRVNE